MKAKLLCREAAETCNGYRVVGATPPAPCGEGAELGQAQLGSVTSGARATPTLTPRPHCPYPKKGTNLAMHIPRI